MAINIMEKHGVRPSHIRRTVELVVAGVFVPDEEDIQASRIMQSNTVAALRGKLADARPRSIWSRLVHPFRDRRVELVRSM
jgi:hypothetical protein